MASVFWTSVVNLMLPGEYLTVPNELEVNLMLRKLGLELRDTILIQLQGKVEVVFLFRKPLLESTVAKQIVKTGTGALNIDSCRIFTDWNEPDRPDSWKSSGYTNKPEAEKIAAPPGQGINCHPKGRWPTNLLFVHSSKCVKQGTKKIPGHKGYPNGPGGKSMQYSSDERGKNVRPDAWEGHADKDGMETVPVWDCHTGCPILDLNDQTSSLHKAGNVRPTISSPGFEGGFKSIEGNPNYYNDEGGAMRFFPQFKSSEEVRDWLNLLVQLSEEEDIDQSFE